VVVSVPTLPSRGDRTIVSRGRRRPATRRDDAAAPSRGLAESQAVIDAALERLDRLLGPFPEKLTPAVHELATIALARSRDAEKLRSCLAVARHDNELLRRAAAVDERLGELLGEGGGIDEVALVVALLTGKPVVVYDAHLRPLVAVDGTTDGVPARAITGAPCPPAALARAIEAVQDGRCELIDALPQIGVEARHAVAPVTVSSERRGYVVVREHPRPFGTLDRHIARRAATDLALVLAAERRVATAECDAPAALVAELVHGGKDPGEVERRARHLGINLDVPHAICLIAGRRPADPPPSAFQLRCALAATEQHLAVVPAPVPEGTICLLELRADAPKAVASREACSRVEAVLARLGSRPDALAIVSRRCTDAADYPRAYLEIRESLACVRTFAGPGATRVIAAAEVGAARVVLASSTRSDVDHFVEDTLGPLLAPEAGVHELLATLAVFFDHARNVRCCAHALGVHENTVRYRLARVERLTGLCVCADASDQLTVQLGLLVLRLEDRLPTVGPAPDRRWRSPQPRGDGGLRSPRPRA